MMNKRVFGFVFLLFVFVLAVYAVDPFSSGINWHALQQITTDETGSVSVDSQPNGVIDNSDACAGDSSCEINNAVISGDLIVSGTTNLNGGLVIETRTSDPSSPQAGRIWLRTDI